MTVSEKLRLVQGLHSHAEMFGFHWDDGSDWTWHDVACKIADEVDAENAKLRELAKRMHYQIKQACDVCDGYYCSNFDEDNECCVYDTLLRELGVETDE